VSRGVDPRPAWARQWNVGPSGAGPRPNAVRPYVTRAAVLAPPGVRQNAVTPDSSPAPADVAASLSRHADVAASSPRHGGVAASLPRHGGVAASSPRHGGVAASSPRHGGVAASSPRHGGVAASSPRHGGVAASSPRHGGVKPPLRPVDLKVSATTAASEPASAKKPLHQVQVFALLVGQVPSHLWFRSFLNRCTDGVYC